MSFSTRGRRFIATVLSLSFLLLHQVSQAQAQVRMRANLMIVDNNGMTLMDANMTNYGATYSNLVDGNDIWKMSNFGENFGIIRQSANLVIERRSLINGTDTTYFRMWNMRQFHYRIQVIAENLQQNNLIAFVRDHYLNQDTPINLNDTSYVDFYVTSTAGSYAQNRFSLIYISNSFAALPVTFTGIQAIKKGANVQVTWQAENEISMDQYIVERSYDGLRFSEIASLRATNKAGRQVYEVNDAQLNEAHLYYRVKALSNNGRMQLSAVAQLSSLTTGAGSVYPNPVEHKQFTLQMMAPATGTYGVTLLHSNGQSSSLGEMYKNAGSVTAVFQLPATISPGIYQLQVNLKGQPVLLKTIVIK